MHERTQYTPLTPDEQEFASNNHYMVWEFLKYHKLPERDWYDVVIFRYLLAVKSWYQRPELHKYPFVSIARRGMSSAIYNERRKQTKCRIQTVSLDSIIPGTEGLSLLDTITEENLKFIIYTEGEDMDISYNIKVPDRDRRRVGQKSDEVLALESFLTTKNLRNMQIAYDTEEEAKKKVVSLQSYRRAKGLKAELDVFRVRNSIYAVKNLRGKEDGQY